MAKLIMTVSSTGRKVIQIISNIAAEEIKKNDQATIRIVVAGKLRGAFIYLDGTSHRRTPIEIRRQKAADELRYAARYLPENDYEEYREWLLSIAEQISTASGPDFSEFWRQFVVVETRNNHPTLSSTEDIIHAITPWSMNEKYHWNNNKSKSHFK